LSQGDGSNGFRNPDRRHQLSHEPAAGRFDPVRRLPAGIVKLRKRPAGLFLRRIVDLAIINAGVQDRSRRGFPGIIGNDHGFGAIDIGEVELEQQAF
jgi:hypothetical protein